MATATATRPFTTGFCNPRNPADSHARCPETLLGYACSCDCHTTTGAGVNAAQLPAKGTPMGGAFSPPPGAPAPAPCPTCGQPWTGAA